MGAGEHQTQTPVWHIRRVHLGGRLTGMPAPRRGQEPGIGRLRHAARGPAGEGRGKGVGERILCRRDLAGQRGEVGYELAIALPRRAFGCTVRGCRAGHITQIGRTSTVP
jgi:hypothetical protein